MRNTAPIISGLLFFTKRSQNYHTVFTKGVYYIDNETRGAELLSNKTAPKVRRKKQMLNYNEKTRTLKLTRREVIDLLLMLDEWTDGSKWQVLHDKLKEQLDVQDNKESE